MLYNWGEQKLWFCQSLIHVIPYFPLYFVQEERTMTYHSEVVGSLLRPTYLLDARKQLEEGSLKAAEFKRIEDRAVNEALAVQEEVGIDVITDGEMRRYAFFGHLIEALEGFDKYGGWAIPFRDESGEEL